MTVLTGNIMAEVYDDCMERGGSGDHMLQAILARLRKRVPEERDQLAAALIQLWHSDFSPEWMGRKEWLRAWWLAGFASDNGHAAPRRSLVVYRGATEATRLRMCWSTSLTVARAFTVQEEIVGNEAPRIIDPTRRVWRAVIPPAGVLARIDQRGEREVIVDPALLHSVRPLD